jgi:hypothetical protein
MTEKVLEEQRKFLPEIAFQRLWMNVWSSGGGDALLKSYIDAAFDETMKPMIGFGGEVVDATNDFPYTAGVDLGIKRDNSAVVVLACGKMGSRYAGRIPLATAKVWKPPKGGKVDLMDIERFILEVDEKLGLERVAFDPWQAEMMAQRVETISKYGRRSGFKTRMSGPWLKEVPPSSTNLRDIAHLVLESFAGRRLQLYPYEALRNDLLYLKVEEKSYGYRLTSPRDGSGHGDTYYAFSLALFAGHNEISEYGPPLNVLP